jgi:hypothetical protein
MERRRFPPPWSVEEQDARSGRGRPVRRGLYQRRSDYCRLLRNRRSNRLGLLGSGAAASRRQVMNSLSVGAPNEQFIGLTNQVTAGLLGLTRREFLVTPMPKECREKTTRSHSRVANRQRSSASLPPNAWN